MNRLFTGLWRHPDFMKLWAGQSISALGSHLSSEGIPLIAVIALAATPEQVGLFSAISAIPVLILSLFAGLWVDRLRRRRVMIVADAGRMFVLLTIPLAALTGHLSLPLLFGVAALMSVLGLFFNLAYAAALPWFIGREQVLEGNSKLSTTESMAEIAGPALAGMLIQTISAPLVVILDALSFLVSVATLAAIHKPEPAPIPPTDRESWWCGINEGLRTVAQQPLLRTIALSFGAQNFFGMFFGTLYAIYALRDLHLTPAILGMLVSGGGIGALIGSLLSDRIPPRVGLGRAMLGSLLLSALVNLMIPLAIIAATPFLAALMLFLPQLIGDAATVFYQVNEVSLRQTIVPDHLLGRTGSAIGLIGQGVAPIGALCAGALAIRIGTAATLLIAVVGRLVVAILMRRSSLRNL